MRHSTVRQKSLILGIFIRLCQDPQALVEIYINYDCDRTAPENLYEKLMNIVSRIGQTHFAPPSKEELQAGSSSSKQASGSAGPAIPPSLSTAALSDSGPQYAGLSPEIKLRRQSLECLVAALRSLLNWSIAPQRPNEEREPRSSEDHAANTSSDLPTPTWPAESRSGTATPLNQIFAAEDGDDVGRFESAKARKTTLNEGIKKFNFKPKRGIEFLLENGFIRSKSPLDVARFLLSCEGLSKAMIGEYLGEA